jgi:tripartite-type tricarboxylate transporter receptor subunit TctC
VGHRSGAQAKPDGYTLTMITFELSTMHHMGIAELSYEDFTCLLQVNADPAAIVVRKDAPWNSLREFLDDARARPGELKMSGTARGGAWDLARAGLLLADGQPVENVLWIPTQGSAPSLVELLGGHIESVCCSVPEAMASLDELKILAVMSDDRLSEYPEIPTAQEAGIDWSAVGWRGLALPLNTPAEAVDRLRETCAKIAASDEYREFMEKSSFAIAIREKEEFVEFLGEQDRQWQQVIQEAGFAAVDE